MHWPFVQSSRERSQSSMFLLSINLRALGHIRQPSCTAEDANMNRLLSSARSSTWLRYNAVLSLFGVSSKNINRLQLIQSTMARSLCCRLETAPLFRVQTRCYSSYTLAFYSVYRIQFKIANFLARSSATSS